MKKKESFSIRKRIKSFGYAIKGLRILISSEHNIWIHLTATIVVITAGIIVDITKSDWFMISVAIALVWITEALNTSIEFIIDMVQPDHHHLAEKAKDVEAAAVLIAAIIAVFIAILVFLPKFI